MRYIEIIGPDQAIDEAKPVAPVKPQKPLTPAQSRQRAKRQQGQQNKINDLQATNAIKMQAARRKLSEI